MKKLGIVITDGVGYRNFVLSTFLDEAELSFDEVVILSFLPRSVFAESENLRVIELSALQEKFPTWFFRKAKEIAHLTQHKKNNFGIADNYMVNRSNASNIRGYATRIIFFLTSFFHSEQWITIFYSLQKLTFKYSNHTKTFNRMLGLERFDILLFTHQRPPYIAPLVYAANRQKAKTCTFIFSWDNIASKGRMAADFDCYLVWSKLMKEELLKFYKKVKPSAVDIVGTPQFEPYVMHHYESGYQEFCNRFNLEPQLKTICFSCGDSSTSRNDGIYISTIAQALSNMAIPKVNLLVRTSPAEGPERFAGIAEQFPIIKWNYPDWPLQSEGHQEQWSQRVPSAQDVKDLRGVVEYSALNINMLSTMSLDFMNFDKPVINVAFGNGKNGLYDDQRFFKYAHIQYLLSSKATRLARTESELISFINHYLANPSDDIRERAAFLKSQVGEDVTGTGRRIALALAGRIT